MERASRAKLGIERTPTAIMTLPRLGPSAATMAMARRMLGKARSTSMVRITGASRRGK
jgi:hypothetical protein